MLPCRPTRCQRLRVLWSMPADLAKNHDHSTSRLEGAWSQGVLLPHSGVRTVPVKRSGRLEKGAEDLPSMLPSLSIRDASRPHTKTSKCANRREISNVTSEVCYRNARLAKRARTRVGGLHSTPAL